MEGKSQNASESSSAPKTAGSSGQATVAITVDLLKMLLESANPNINADLLLAKAGIVPTPPPADELAASTGAEGSAAEPIEAVPEDTQGRTEQPLLTPAEVVANLSTSDNEATKKSVEKEAENPTEGVDESTARINRKRATPRDEAAKARAATVHIYQRRPARVEASRKSTTEEPRNKAPEQKIEGGGGEERRKCCGATTTQEETDFG